MSSNSTDGIADLRAGTAPQVQVTEPVRVAVATSSLPHAGETFIRRHIIGLDASVIALTMDPRDLTAWPSTPEVSALQVRPRRKKSFSHRVLRRLQELMLGIPAPKWPSRMDEVWDRHVAMTHPDVVLAEFAPVGMCVMDACRRHALPLVVHFHGYDASALLRLPSYRRRLPKLFKTAAAVVVVSNHMRTTLLGLGCPPAKLHVIPCGAPVEEFRPSGAVSRQPCKFTAVASMLPGKGPLLTLRAFNHVLQYEPGLTLAMIGAGKLLGPAQMMAKRLGMARAVEFLGWQPPETVRQRLAEAGAFVQHSVTTRLGGVEGWGVSIAEAAASGLPVAATRHGGIPDQVIDGKTGFLVEEGDWQAMAGKMMTLARDPELRRRMGLAGRKTIETVGNCTIQIEKLKTVLQAASKARFKKPMV